MFFRAEEEISNGKILVTVSIISELFQRKYMFLKIAAKLLLRNVLKLAASLLPNMAGWLLQSVEMFTCKCLNYLFVCLFFRVFNRRDPLQPKMQFFDATS